MLKIDKKIIINKSDALFVSIIIITLIKYYLISIFEL